MAMAMTRKPRTNSAPASMLRPLARAGRRRPRGPGPGGLRALATSRAASPAPRRCLYEVLGVGRDASLGEVKLAYFARAKAVHPDTREEDGAAEAGDHEAFLELVEAYETLSCPRKRRIYDTQGSHAGSQHDSRAGGWPGDADEAGPDATAATAADRRSPYEPWKPGWGQHDLAYYRKGMTLFESIRDELHEALATARLGPQVPDFEAEGLETMFPWAFEAETRSDDSHEHILQLVSGRQALGYVEVSTDPLLHLSPSGAVGESSGVAGGTPFEATDLDLDLVYQGRHVARAYRRGTHIIIFGTDMSSRSGPGTDGGEELRHLATIVPRGTPGASETGFLRALMLPKLPPLSTRVPTPPSPENPFAPRARPVSFDVLDDEMRPTHRVLQWSALGVDTVYWFRGEKLVKSRLGSARVANCAVKVTRASLPSPRFWLFEPRSAAHTDGSWYFELSRPELSEDQIAAAAQRYLQRVSREDAAAPRSSLAPRLSQEVKLSWVLEKAAAQERHERGVVDPRVPVLFSAFATLRA